MADVVAGWTEFDVDSAHVPGTESAACVMKEYGSTGCGASILAAAKQKPRDNRDLQLSYMDLATLLEVAARIKYKLHAEDALSVWKKRCARAISATGRI
jgi:hypothetical protein